MATTRSAATSPKAAELPQTSDGDPASRRRGRGRPRLLAGAAVGLLVLGGGAWLGLSRFLARPPAAPRPVEVGATVPVGSLVLNLGGPQSRRYLKVGVELGVPGPRDVKAVEERRAQILDLLITTFSQTSPETFGSPAGLAALKQALLGRLREELHLERVAQVYLTELVIQ